MEMLGANRSRNRERRALFAVCRWKAMRPFFRVSVGIDGRKGWCGDVGEVRTAKGGMRGCFYDGEERLPGRWDCTSFRRMCCEDRLPNGIIKGRTVIAKVLL